MRIQVNDVVQLSSVGRAVALRCEDQLALTALYGRVLTVSTLWDVDWLSVRWMQPDGSQRPTTMSYKAFELVISPLSLVAEELPYDSS